MLHWFRWGIPDNVTSQVPTLPIHSKCDGMQNKKWQELQLQKEVQILIYSCLETDKKWNGPFAILVW